MTLPKIVSSLTDCLASAVAELGCNRRTHAHRSILSVQTIQLRSRERDVILMPTRLHCEMKSLLLFVSSPPSRALTRLLEYYKHEK
jgi:hypothetical protein